MRPQSVGPERTELAVANEWKALERSTVVASVTVTPAGQIVAANPRFMELTGLDKPVAGLSLLGLLSGQEARRVWCRVQQDGVAHGIELAVRARGGTERLLKGDFCTATMRDGASVLWGLFTDISEERQLRSAVQRGARLEALGSLTSGVAHDFNNLLTVLVGNLSLVAEELRSHPSVFAKLKSARDAARRGADLIGQLLSFARRESIEADTIDPGRVVENLAGLLQRALGSRVELATELEPGAGPILGNVALLESAIVNLTVNARDALGADGKVAIGVANVSLSGEQAVRYGLVAGEFVSMTVRDNGCGIAPDAIERVFEPFFSTKQEQGGTGLGLSMVRSYAEQARGAVCIDSELGKGTCVRLLLPRSSNSIDETSAGTMPLSTLPTGDEAILVYAAEDGLCATIRQILEVLGYSVRLAGNTDELMAQWADIDLVIVDSAENANAVCNGLSRAELSQRRVVVLTTGEEAREWSADSLFTSLPKPFSLADLADTVRSSLDV